MSIFAPAAPSLKEIERNSHGRTETCKEVFASLSDYLDLELPLETCEEIRDHLAGCPSCIEFTESLRATIELCRQYRPAELPAPIEKQAREQLLQAMRRCSPGKKSRK